MRTTRLIVCGSRNWEDWELLNTVLCDLLNSWRIDDVSIGVTQQLVVVHGACPFGGADAMAERWVREQAEEGWNIVSEPHPPRAHSTPAFHNRNQKMAELGARLCISFTDGKQNGVWGSGDMISRALSEGIPARAYPSSRKQKELRF